MSIAKEILKCSTSWDAAHFIAVNRAVEMTYGEDEDGPFEIFTFSDGSKYDTRISRDGHQAES